MSEEEVVDVKKESEDAVEVEPVVETSIVTEDENGELVPDVAPIEADASEPAIAE